MDRKGKESIVFALREGPKGTRTRLVLGLTPPPTVPGKFVPADFKTRKEYRQALINSQLDVQQSHVDIAVSNLSLQGLDVRAYPLANTIVVEGSASQLEHALDDEHVETASFDDEFKLIEPFRG